MKSLTSSQQQIDFRNLEKDLVVNFLVNKPIISDPALARIPYQFKKESDNLLIK